jgi:hypothetical protein
MNAMIIPRSIAVWDFPLAVLLVKFALGEKILAPAIHLTVCALMHVLEGYSRKF